MSQSPANAWRGIAAEDADDVSPGLSSFLRQRSRRLMRDLLGPHRVQVPGVAQVDFQQIARTCRCGTQSVGAFVQG